MLMLGNKINVPFFFFPYIPYIKFQSIFILTIQHFWLIKVLKTEIL